MGDVVAHANQVMKRPSAGDRCKLRRYLVAAVGAAVGFFKPLLDAVVAKNMLAPRQAERSFDNALRASLAEVVVADDTCYGDGLAPKVVVYGWGNGGLLRSVVGRVSRVTLCNEERAFLDATRLLDNCPRNS